MAKSDFEELNDLNYNPKKARPSISEEPKEDTSAMMAQLQKMQAQLERLDNSNKQLATENNELKRGIIEAPIRKREAEAVTDIISGFEGTFKKHYKFSVLEAPDIEFDVELRPITAADYINVGRKAAEITGGQIAYFDMATSDFANAIATLSTVGVNVPDYLTDIDKVYRLDIVNAVYYDYVEWSERFRQRQSK